MTASDYIKFVLSFLKPKDLARLLFSAAAHLAAPQVQAEAERALGTMSAEAFTASGQDALDYHDAVEANDRKAAAAIVARMVGKFRP